MACGLKHSEPQPLHSARWSQPVGLTMQLSMAQREALGVGGESGPEKEGIATLTSGADNIGEAGSVVCHTVVSQF